MTLIDKKAAVLTALAALMVKADPTDEALESGDVVFLDPLNIAEANIGGQVVYLRHRGNPTPPPPPS